MKKLVTIALAVLIPPFIGCMAVLGWNLHDSSFVGNYLLIGGGALLWSLVAFFYRGRVFFGGLIGLQLAMAGFVTWALAIKLESLGWVFYLPAQVVSLVGGILVSLCFKKRLTRR